MSHMINPVLYPVVQDGKYTIMYPGDQYRTILIHTPKRGNLAGKTILKIKQGSEFEGVAFISGQYGVSFWKKYRAQHPDKVGPVRRAYETVASNPEMHGKLYAERSHRCYVCDRELTTPASLAAGIGPECAGKRGGRWTAQDQRDGATKLRNLKEVAANQEFAPLTPAVTLPTGQRAVAIHPDELMMMQMEAQHDYEQSREEDRRSYMADMLDEQMYRAGVA